MVFACGSWRSLSLSWMYLKRRKREREKLIKKKPLLSHSNRRPPNENTKFPLRTDQASMLLMEVTTRPLTFYNMKHYLLHRQSVSQSVSVTSAIYQFIHAILAGYFEYAGRICKPPANVQERPIKPTTTPHKSCHAL